MLFQLVFVEQKFCVLCRLLVVLDYVRRKWVFTSEPSQYAQYKQHFVVLESESRHSSPAF